MHVTLPVLGMSEELPNCAVVVSSCLCHLIAICLALVGWLPSVLRSSFFFSFDTLTSAFSSSRLQLVKGLLGSIYCEIHGNISMGRARVTSLCSQARSNLSWKISKDDTQEGKSSAVWLGLSWNLALLGGTGDRCSMTATSRTPDLMRMMAGEGSRVTCTLFLGKAILLARLRSCFIDGQGGGLGRGNWG